MTAGFWRRTHRTVFCADAVFHPFMLMVDLGDAGYSFPTDVAAAQEAALQHVGALMAEDPARIVVSGNA